MSDNFTKVGIPAKIEITRNFDRLQIVRKWLGFKFYLFTPFAIAWDAFLLFWGVLTFLFHDHLVIMLLILLLLMVSGIWLTYYLLTGYLNKTVIDVDVDFLTIKHGPLPSGGNKKISSKTLKQLYCTRREYFEPRLNPYATCDLRAITDDQRNIMLIEELDNSEQALFIEREIEKFLNIEDRPVKGAIR